MCRKKQTPKLDDLDIDILQAVFDRPGKSQQEILESFVDHRTIQALRTRAANLASHKLILRKGAPRGNRLVLTITKAGIKALEEAKRGRQ